MAGRDGAAVGNGEQQTASVFGSGSRPSLVRAVRLSAPIVAPFVMAAIGPFVGMLVADPLVGSLDMGQAGDYFVKAIGLFLLVFFVAGLLAGLVGRGQKGWLAAAAGSAAGLALIVGIDNLHLSDVGTVGTALLFVLGLISPGYLVGRAIRCRGASAPPG